MSAVWDMCMNDPAEKFVLLAYADHADHQGGSIYPAVSTIAQKTGYEDRSIRRITRRLIETGFLVPQGKGPKGVIRYRLDLTKGQPEIKPTPDPESPDPESPDPEGSPDLTLTPETPDPGSANPSGTVIEPSSAAIAASESTLIMETQNTNIADATRPASTAFPSVAHDPDGATDYFNRFVGFTGNQKLLRKAANMKNKKPYGPGEMKLAEVYCQLSGHELADVSEARKQLEAASAILAQPGAAGESHLRTAWANSRPTPGNRGFPVTSLWSLKETARMLAREERTAGVTADAAPAAYELLTLPNGAAAIRVDGQAYVGDAARNKCAEMGITWRS